MSLQITLDGKGYLSHQYTWDAGVERLRFTLHGADVESLLKSGGVRVVIKESDPNGKDVEIVFEDFYYTNLSYSNGVIHVEGRYEQQ